MDYHDCNDGVFFQTETLSTYMQVPNSLERKLGEDDGRNDTPASGISEPEESPSVKSEDPLMDALEYFRQQPVPVKKARRLWPFKKIPS
jgi:hypothetical protein